MLVVLGVGAYNNLPKESYPDLYEEIDKDYKNMYQKFRPIDYPTSEPVLKQRPHYPPTK